MRQRNTYPMITPTKFTWVFIDTFQELGKAIEEVRHAHRVVHGIINGEHWLAQPLPEKHGMIVQHPDHDQEKKPTIIDDNGAVSPRMRSRGRSITQS